jgi:hypothetical protein
MHTTLDYLILQLLLSKSKEWEHPNCFPLCIVKYKCDFHLSGINSKFFVVQNAVSSSNISIFKANIPLCVCVIGIYIELSTQLRFDVY